MRTVTQVARGQIRELRKRRGWTQEELGQKLDVHSNVISGLERGNRALGLDEWLVFASVLEVAPIDLLVPPGSDESIELAPNLEAPPDAVRGWICGLEGPPDAVHAQIRRSLLDVDDELGRLDEGTDPPDGRRLHAIAKRLETLARRADAMQW